LAQILIVHFDHRNTDKNTDKNNTDKSKNINVSESLLASMSYSLFGDDFLGQPFLFDLFGPDYRDVLPKELEA